MSGCSSRASTFIVNIAFPDIQADFAGSSLGALSWILNAYAIVFAALLVPAGRWADALGRKRVFLGGLAVFTFASALCAVAPSVELLVAARVLQAAGGAMLLPTSLALLLPEFTAEKRPVAIGIWAAAGGVAAAAGPPIGGLLVQLSWHWVFLVNIPIGLAALVAGSRILHESRDPLARRPDLLAALALILGVATLVGGIVKGEDWGWGGGGVLGAFALARAEPCAGDAERRRRHRARGDHQPGLERVAAPDVGQEQHGPDQHRREGHEEQRRADDGQREGPHADDLRVDHRDRMGARALDDHAQQHRADGNRLVGSIGALLMALGAVYWLSFLGTDQAYASTFLPGFMIGGAGVGLVNPSLTAAAAASLPPARFATGAALITMGRQIGSAIGVALLVPVLGSGLDASAYDGAWLLMMSFALGSAAALWLMGRAPGTVPASAPVATQAAEGVAEQLALGARVPSASSPGAPSRGVGVRIDA